MRIALVMLSSVVSSVKWYYDEVTWAETYNVIFETFRYI